MAYTEKPLVFSCEDDTLLGILSLPEAITGAGVLIIVGGPQYRAGSHRQFTLLARSLAAAGHPVLRFDYRGMGDSAGQVRNFESVNADIGAALNAMQQQIPTLQHIALWGLCDGASAALLYCQATDDARVAGLCLLNPWVRSEASLARTQVKHYYLQRLAQREFWSKLISGKVAGSAVSGLLRNLRLSAAPSKSAATDDQPYQTRMATAWNGFRGDILLLLSGDDYTAKEFLDYARSDKAWLRTMNNPQLTMRHLVGADHTFSERTSQSAVENFTRHWLTAELTTPTSERTDRPAFAHGEAA